MENWYKTIEEMFEKVRVKRPELWKAYKTWCAQSKERQTKQQEFFTYLEAHGFPIGQGRSRQWYVYGLRLKETQEEDFERVNLMVKVIPYLTVQNGKKAIALYEKLFEAKVKRHEPFTEEIGKELWPKLG